MKIAEIIINSNAKDLNRTFDYIVPDEMEEDISVGARVFVPFGKTVQEGYVITLNDNFDEDKYEYKLKEIARVEDNKYLNEEKINLAKYLSKRYLCNISDCINLMLPPGNTKNINNRIKAKTARFVKVNYIPEKINDKQKMVIDILEQNGEMLVSEVQNILGISSSIIRTLEKYGIVETYEKEISRNPFINKNVEKTKKLKLNKEQKEALEKINDAIDDEMNTEFLLFGITGSGKTEIYLQAIDKVLQKDKSAIMLVPEISLTPQTVDRFISRFGEDKIAVIHSKLSNGERFDEWNKIFNGDAKVVIGARSAIFAPVKNLGIVIIDEEHDTSYKSEMTPRYDAKDVAKYLAREANCPLVLGSATPSLESYKLAKEEKIELLELSKRANDAVLPEVKIVDMRDEIANGNNTMISEELKEAISENLKKKEQVILFLNRRGYSTFVMCRECGYTLKCPNCNVTMTYHMHEQKLKCHYCGHLEEPVVKCPKCGSEKIKYFGTGTQKLEMTIHEMFPEASTIRMDVDTVTKKNSHEDILNKFKNEKIDILIGTQMVVKGHDFPNVTLVGVMAADSSLGINDFRAEERTFQILTQVAGRAGRSKEKPGRVIIQAYNPDNLAIELASKQDYKKFYETEIVLRKELKYPPFCDIIMFVVSGVKEDLVIKKAKEIHGYLKKRILDEKIGVLLYSPVTAPIDKIQNKFRWRIIVKCLYTEDINELIQDAICNCTSSRDEARTSVDINPYNMM